MTTSTDYQIVSQHARHGHLFEVVVRFCGSDIWVDLETGFATGAGGRVHSPANAETLAELRERTGWKTPVTYVDHIDDETGEWNVVAEPCAGCEQLKRAKP